MSLAFCLPPIPPGGCGTVDTATFATGRIHKQFSEDNFSWKATVDWKLTDETMLYASGSRGYRSEEHTSELQSLMRISYAVFCLKKKKKNNTSNSLTRSKKYTQNTSLH